MRDFKMDNLRTLALLGGLVILVLGALGFIVPSTWVMIASYGRSPLGLFVTSLARVAIGLALLGAAPSSRSPIGLRLVGAFHVLLAFLPPFVGVDRAQAWIDSWSASGTGNVRLWAIFAIALGMFVVWAVTGSRRPVGTRARFAA